jgi:hypothetical protein
VPSTRTDQLAEPRRQSPSTALTSGSPVHDLLRNAAGWPCGVAGCAIGAGRRENARARPRALAFRVSVTGFSPFGCRCSRRRPRG